MRDYVLLTDSSCDLSQEMANRLGLRVVPLSFHIGGEEFRNYLDGRDISFPEFYRRIRGGEVSTTSAPSVGTFAEVMKAEAKAGRDVLCLAFSSGLSSTCQSARIAAEQVRQEYPHIRISVVDTLCASGGQGLLVWLCAREKAAGASLDQVRDYAERWKGKVCHWFTVDDLQSLKRGGRINAATALLGTMLSVKPVLHMNDEGRLVNVAKARGRRAALLALVDQMEKTAENPAKQTIFITHGDCQADAEFVAEEIRRRMGIRDAVINILGPVIGSHTGPGLVALFFLGQPR